LSVGLYIPKGTYGAAVHTVLKREQRQLAQALGGLVLQHKEVQREFRHFVRREHRYRPETVEDAVRWCVERVRAAHDYVEHSRTLLDSAILRAIHADLIEPTDDPDALEARVDALLSAGKSEKPLGNEKPLRKPSPPSERFVRDPQVVAYVQQRARGDCEACLKKAPFERDDGAPFLETHHLTRLADGGPDTVENAVAVCPNCHRLLHHGRLRAERARQIRERLFAKKAH
jgi:hypothetical protein